jgi:hypothetical protein
MNTQTVNNLVVELAVPARIIHPIPLAFPQGGLPYLLPTIYTHPPKVHTQKNESPFPNPKSEISISSQAIPAQQRSQPPPPNPYVTDTDLVTDPDPDPVTDPDVTDTAKASDTPKRQVAHQHKASQR